MHKIKSRQKRTDSLAIYRTEMQGPELATAERHRPERRGYFPESCGENSQKPHRSAGPVHTARVVAIKKENRIFSSSLSLHYSTIFEIMLYKKVTPRTN